MDNTLIIGASHGHSLGPLTNYYNNIKFVNIYGLTLYGILKKKDIVFDLIDKKYMSYTNFKNVIIVIGYGDINGSILYLKYNKDPDWIKKTLLKGVQNFESFMKLFRSKYTNKNIYICNPIVSPFTSHPDIITYKLYKSIIITYTNQDKNITQQQLIKYQKIVYKNYKKKDPFFKNLCQKYNINKALIKNIIKQRISYIPFFEKKLKQSCIQNNIILLNLNPYLQKIVSKKCVSLWSDVNRRFEYNHHYIFELFTICFLLSIKKHISIKSTVLQSLYADYKKYVLSTDYKKISNKKRC